MVLRTLTFLATVLLVLSGACVYMAERSMVLCPGLAAHPALVWGTLGLLTGLMFAVPALRRVLGRRGEPLYALSYGWFGFNLYAELNAVQLLHYEPGATLCPSNSVQWWYQRLRWRFPLRHW